MPSIDETYHGEEEKALDSSRGRAAAGAGGTGIALISEYLDGSTNWVTQSAIDAAAGNPQTMENLREAMANLSAAGATKTAVGVAGTLAVLEYGIRRAKYDGDRNQRVEVGYTQDCDGLNRDRDNTDEYEDN